MLGHTEVALPSDCPSWRSWDQAMRSAICGGALIMARLLRSTCRKLQLSSLAQMTLGALHSPVNIRMNRKSLPSQMSLCPSTPLSTTVLYQDSHRAYQLEGCVLCYQYGSACQHWAHKESNSITLLDSFPSALTTDNSGQATTTDKRA